MVYDEGFAMEFEDLSFFAFSNYEIATDEDSIKTYKSKCYSTCVGWYRNKDGSQWGCYRAQKIGRNPSTVTYTTTTDSKENSVINKENVVTVSNRINDNIIENSYRLNKPKTHYHKVLYKKQRSTQNLMKSFLSLKDSSKLLLLDSSFNMHHLYVAKLNKINKNWHAEVNNEFKKLSIKDLNKIAGIPRNSQFRFSIKKAINLKGNEGEDLAMFPKDFDWMEKVRPAGSQGACGSCYALSTIRMVEARLRILYNENINLSVQHALDCSFYNQGCNGGYPFLVMKYGKENLFIPEKCSVYKGTKGKCDSTCDLEKLQYLYGMMNYGYVGGSYGQCSEKKIMEEVYKNGPIVVSFEPDYNFMMYKSGIYHTLDESNWKSQGLPKPEWLKVDHSVLLVGWGEDKELSEKYWILQNTWGPEWGEKGFFRVRRGVDEMGIESICESGIPIVVDNTKKKEIFPQNNLIFN